MLSSHLKFSLHLLSYLARCLAGLLGPWDLGVVWLLQIAFVVSPLAMIHLVLVHGWVVLLVGPLVPGVQPWEAGTLVTFSLLFLLGPFSCAGGLLLGPLSFGSLCFHVLLATLGLGVLL